MKPLKTLVFILAVIALLAVICVIFPKDGVLVGGKHYFFPTLEDIMVREKSVSASARIQLLESQLQMQAAKDSARNDSLLFFEQFFETHPAAFSLPQTQPQFFDALFAEMDNCCSNNTAVHILHYGDSQIEEDRISGVFRQRLQERFGGIGAGLMPAVQLIPSAAVGQSTGGNFGRYVVSGMHKNRAAHNRYGALGQVTQVTGSATVSFAANNYGRTFENTKQWSRMRVFLGQHSKNFSATLTAKNLKQKQTVENQSNRNSVMLWDTDTLKRVSFTFSGSAEVLGIALESPCGVFVDNVPLRGSAGTFFTQIEKQSVEFMLNAMNVRLIILQFGGNMMPQINSQKGIDKYMETFSAQIRYLQTLCPQSKILVIGPADMSKKVRGKLQTYPFLPELVEAMKITANQSGAAFWNMFAVMGGSGSMIEWVREKPTLAAPDYIHFTPRGANKAGEMLYEAMMKYYDFYKFNNNNK
ncbi:MAG: hypothetical protein LBS01_10955 [Prevotellaceae bacterium]|nr:hypothetical protein [Prevotellaceae bacterium]